MSWIADQGSPEACPKLTSGLSIAMLTPVEVVDSSLRRVPVAQLLVRR
jgi:hypothetical protein